MAALNPCLDITEKGIGFFLFFYKSNSLNTYSLKGQGVCLRMMLKLYTEGKLKEITPR